MAYTPDQFYLLGAGIEYGAMSQYVKEYPERVKDKVQYDFDLLAGKEGSAKPVIFGHNGGTRPKDFMSANPPILLISDRVVEVLKKGRFTGWSTFPARVFNKKREEVSGYSGLVVTGKCGPIDDSKSEWVQVPASEKYGSYRARYGYYFDLKMWDGSDIFLAEGTGVRFVTERVAEALESAKLTNLELIKSTEFERMW
ncbi:MAG: hypothetical protein WC659_03705 [Patescibacteria group bacterium]